MYCEHLGDGQGINIFLKDNASNNLVIMNISVGSDSISFEGYVLVQKSLSMLKTKVVIVKR